jgi:hypothetical protein
MAPMLTPNYHQPELTTGSRHNGLSDTKEKTDKINQFERTTRRSFTSNLFDFAFHRGEKRYRRSDSVTKIDCTTASSSTDVKNHGLSHIPESDLIKCIEPILSQLQQLDAEELLCLTRVHNGGAPLRDG